MKSSSSSDSAVISFVTDVEGNLEYFERFVQLSQIAEKEQRVIQFSNHGRWNRNIRFWAAVVIQRCFWLH